MRRLYETKRLLPLCAEVVVIAAKPEKQLAWLMARNDLSDQQVGQPRHRERGHVFHILNDKL